MALMTGAVRQRVVTALMFCVANWQQLLATSYQPSRGSSHSLRERHDASNTEFCKLGS